MYLAFLFLASILKTSLNFQSATPFQVKQRKQSSNPKILRPVTRYVHLIWTVMMESAVILASPKNCYTNGRLTLCCSICWTLLCLVLSSSRCVVSPCVELLGVVCSPSFHKTYLMLSELFLKVRTEVLIHCRMCSELIELTGHYHWPGSWLLHMSQVI